MDVAIVNVPWNGIWQAMKIAGLAESFEVNVAPHNFYGHPFYFDERPFLCSHPQLPHHGNRHR